jgi:inner membrane transporter RhtA
MVGALLVAAPITLAYIITGHTSLGRADADHLAIAVSVGLLGSVFPFLLFNAAISKITATLAGLLLTLIPVFGSATSIFLLGETIGIPQVVGGALVILAAAAVTVATPTSP